MQFHQDGFRVGDPDVALPSQDYATHGRPETVPQEVDVLIVGCGPAGLTLAAQLSRFADIKTCIVEQKPGPLTLGQADGIACRSMEMFEAFGFVDRVLRESYWVNETTFWRPSESDPHKIVRSGRVQDVEDGLSQFPHVILNQARVHDFYLDVMRHSPNRLEPYYARKIANLTVDTTDGLSHPVTVTLERTDAGHEGEHEVVKARYVVGQSLGRSLHGDSANVAWGVMDVLAVTDFPDIRHKTLIRSTDEGSIIIIPREGGHLARFYVELDKLNPNERVASRNITREQLIAAAQRIVRPYTLDVKETAWWSIYEIGQRLCDKFDDVPEDQLDTRLPHVFIAGDACHTHSPKAGQGMNVSMQDAFNLGWKLAAVLQGRSAPSLLHTYSAERQAIAKELIDFDREWAAMLSATNVDPAEVQSYFVRQGHYTAGTATYYKPALLTGESTHQNLAKGLTIGKRLHSAPVVRLGDSKPMQLGSAFEADGRWRIFAFADREVPSAATSGISKLCAFLADSPDSPVRRHTPAGADLDSVIDLRAVFQQPHRDLHFEHMPALLQPFKGKLQLRDYEKMFCVDHKSGHDIFDMRGIDRDKGCIVVVRPDQYVGTILPLDAFGDLAAYFDRILLRQG